MNKKAEKKPKKIKLSALKENRFYKKAMWLLALSICLIMILELTGEQYYASTISFQYKGIDKGLNPDGTRFEINKLISEEVMKLVFEKAQLNYDAENLSQFEVKPLLPIGIVETIKQKREKGEPYTYFPNEFEIRIHPKLFGNLNFMYAKKISASYKDGYESYFKDTYQYPFTNLENTFGQFDYSKYDYPEVTKVLDNEYNMLISYLSVLQDEDPQFRSAKKLSFQDMVATLRSSKSLDLNRISATVNAFNLTKNKEMLILKYQYMIRRYELEKNKDFGEYSISKELLSILKTKENGVILPSISGSPVTVKTLDKSYDALAKKYNDAIVLAGNKDEDIKYFQKEIVKLQNSQYSAEELKKAASDVDLMISVLNGKLSTWVKSIKEIADEYFEQEYGNAIRLTQNSHLTGGLSLKKLAVEVALVWSFLCGVFYLWDKKENPLGLLTTIKRLVEK